MATWPKKEFKNVNEPTKAKRSYQAIETDKALRTKLRKKAAKRRGQWIRQSAIIHL